MSPSDPPIPVERGRDLSRFATVRTGGAAEWFARVGSEDDLVSALSWARDAALPVAVLGSGSNLLIADEGVDGLVLKLDGSLARVEIEGERASGGAGERVSRGAGERTSRGAGEHVSCGAEAHVSCGGGARLPAVAAATARAGLAGIEFGVNIPGTVGGAVRMNANAYGGRLADVLRSVRIATADGVDERSPEALGFAYRSSSLADGEVVALARLQLRRDDPDAIRARLGELRAWRHEAQPQGIKTFGSTFKNPGGSATPTGAKEAAGQELVTAGQELVTAGQELVTAGQELVTAGQELVTAGRLLSEAGCNGLRVGDARFAIKHANFVENLGGATTAQIVELMAEGRRRVLECCGVALEPEVQTLGPVRFPWEG